MKTCNKQKPSMETKQIGIKAVMCCRFQQFMNDGNKNVAGISNESGGDKGKAGRILAVEGM